MLERRREELRAALATALADGRIAPRMALRLRAALDATTRTKELLLLEDEIGRRLAHGARVAPARDPPPRPPPPSPPGGIDDVIATFYEAISWTGGRPPSRAALFAVVAVHAPFIHGGGAEDREAFWRRVERWSHAAYLPLVQREVAASTTSSGAQAHRISRYEAVCADDRVVGRGIHSFELAHDGARWLIASVAWEETPSPR